MDAEQLADVVREIEEEKALNRVSGIEVFRGMLNQPDLVSVSSANATAGGGANSYTEFTVNLPRPSLEVKTLELLSANIPLCTQNIPDTGLVFWYYRLNEYSGPVPNAQNLAFVRLLPSYYKPEFFQPTPTRYGQNVTFPGYTDVATQLDLACKNDLAYDNALGTIEIWQDEGGSYQSSFFPSDVSITYNSTLNKFQMTGLNTDIDLFAASSPDTWDAETTYALGEYVTFGSETLVGTRIYRSLIAGNLNNPPTVANGEYGLLSSPLWAYASGRLVKDFDAETPYYAGQYVVYPTESGTILQAVNNNIGEFDEADWEEPQFPRGPYALRYLPAGYGDPNIPLVQGTGRVQWNPYALFDDNRIVEYLGDLYISTRQSKGFLPFITPNEFDEFDAAKQYIVGDYAYFVIDDTAPFFVCIKDSTGNLPTDTEYWSPIEFDPTKTDYQPGDLITWDGDGKFDFWKCIATPPAQASPIATGGFFNTNPYWIPQAWYYVSPELAEMVGVNAAIVGLNAISSRFDMVDAVAGQPQFPFPAGIPGQPFNPTTVRRTLNSLLGFAWNGVYNPTAVNAALTDINLPTISGTTDVLNRIRPVPFYFPVPAGVGSLGSGSSVTATVYTAEAYANLVYSSVISIYSTIVYGSTLDSQRNTNLLAVSALNAGNLGISYFQHVIDNKLSVNSGDIYAITIELRDECNEPYPITNNGICTFTLKLTYKEPRKENKEK
jgi:hypothetical protein